MQSEFPLVTVVIKEIIGEQVFRNPSVDSVHSLPTFDILGLSIYHFIDSYTYLSFYFAWGTFIKALW